MTIFLKMLKYDYMQYDYFFEKIVIYYEKSMTKKKPMPHPHDLEHNVPATPRNIPDFDDLLLLQCGG